MTTPAPAPPSALCELHGIVKRYGGVTAVDDVSLDVGRGEVVSIIGPNGAGKSTLLNIATGITRADGGRVRFDGEDVSRLDATGRARRGIGRTFQNVRLFKTLTVRETVALGMYAAERPGILAALAPGIVDRSRRARWLAAADEMLALLGFHDHADREAMTLPLGDQRKVEIARALVARPRLLYLDEPCAGMLSSELEGFAGLLRWMRDTFAMSIVLIEHHIDLVLSVSDRVFILHDGTRVAHGTPAELQSSAQLRQVYLGE